MAAILDKFILLFCSLFLSLSLSVGTGRVIVLILLCVFITLTLDEFFDALWFSYLSFFAGLFLSFLLPELLFFLPAFVYPMFSKHRTLLCLLSLLPMIASPLLQANLLHACLLFFLSVLSVLLADREHSARTLTSDLIHLRDADKEEQLSLRQQARNLEETQDANIKIATLQERTRIAREIHDNVGHLLSRSLLQVGAMLTVKKDDEALLLLKESLDNAMNGIRSSVHDLRDDALDLETSAKQLLSDYTSYQTYFEYDIAPELPVAITYCFLTITKEALANITKHSNADTIRISMREYTSLYRLSIADNGTDSTIPEGNTGMGLENMQARVASLKGTIRFSTQNGFHIFVSIPKEEHP